LKKLALKVFDVFGFRLEKKSSPDQRSKTIRTAPILAQQQIINRLGIANVCIFDVGANKGQSAKTYRAAFPKADIYCFEPIPEMLVKLENQFSTDNKIHIEPKAVAQKKGSATFYVNAHVGSSSLLKRTSDEKRYYKKEHVQNDSIEVETISLDEFVQENNISKAHILKFDIQGGELQALKGAESLLRSGNTSIVYTEVSFTPLYDEAPLFDEIWSFLKHLGYTLYSMSNLHWAANGQILYGEATFVSEEMRENVIDKYPEER